MDVGKREKLLRAFDWLAVQCASRRFGLFGPCITYQPLPWVGIPEGSRAIGSRRRMEALLSYLQERGTFPRTTLDIGANVGFFSLSFAERGAVAYAVEGEEINARLATIAARRIKGTGRAVVIRMWCNPDNISELPNADVTLCLSVWHHWVRHMGLDAATAILANLMAKTSTALFFDTGEEEMPDSYRLPFRGQDAGEWLEKYLSALPGARSVRLLGRYEAFAPATTEKTGRVSRHLFAIEA
jgi:SAM-dependent methyltransferase